MTKHTELTDVLPNQHGDTKLVINIATGNIVLQWRCVKLAGGKAYMLTSDDNYHPTGNRGRPDILGIAQGNAGANSTVDVCIYGKTKAVCKIGILSGWRLESRGDGKVGSVVVHDLTTDATPDHVHGIEPGPDATNLVTDADGGHTHQLSVDAHTMISGAFLGLAITPGDPDDIIDIILMRG